MLAGGAWGWHIETAVHIIRIVCGGVFDRFPKLQFVIGHMGEGLPFFFQRLDIIPVATTKLKHPISHYLKNNVHYTFSGMVVLSPRRTPNSTRHPEVRAISARPAAEHLRVTAIV